MNAWSNGRALIGLVAVCMAGLIVSQATGADAAHYLGPTGITGITSAKQIEVTQVEAGSPAEGKIAPKALILGANGKRFESDARREIADAIDQAETEQAKGVLRLMVQGNAEPVELQLEALGTYSATAPFDCAKTDAIITRAAEQMVKTGSYKKGELAVGWLGLMATGEQKYIDLVKRELPKEDWVHPDKAKIEALLRGETDMGYVCWRWGYQCITMAEYYLLTGDKSVLPALEVYATALAQGQDVAGRWGHRMASPRFDGRLPGYSHINQPSLTCYMGLLLARKCGIDAPVIDKAIKRSHLVYSRYTGQGALPYGNHGPFTHIFNNNGTSGSVALTMALVGDRKGTRFFSQQAATSYDGIETGHATHYFNILWTPLGANLAGPEVTARFFAKTRWLHTLARTADHRFTFDGGEQNAGNSGGSHLLAYCLGRRALYITGKDADQTIWLDPEAATRAVELSQMDYKANSVDELLTLLDHPAPQVTRRAVWTLREREFKFGPQLGVMIKQGTKTQKLSAIGFYGYKCPAEAALPRLDALAAVMNNRDEDAEVRAAAATSLSWIGEPAYKHFNAMLRFVVEDRPKDELRLVDEELGKALTTLCKDPLTDGLVTDKELFYRAVRKLAQHPLQGTRANAMTLIASMPLGDFHFVADDVKQVVLNRDPSYTSYHNPGSSVAAGATVLAHLNIAEGMAWGWGTLDTPDGKHAFKMNAVVRILSEYGPHAKAYVDKVKADPDKLKQFAGGRWKKGWDALVQVTETTKPEKPLITFEAAKSAGIQQ